MYGTCYMPYINRKLTERYVYMCVCVPHLQIDAYTHRERQMAMHSTPTHRYLSLLVKWSDEWERKEIEKNKNKYSVHTAVHTVVMIIIVHRVYSPIKQSKVKLKRKKKHFRVLSFILSFSFPKCTMHSKHAYTKLIKRRSVKFLLNV